jgi:hypothetical protein
VTLLAVLAGCGRIDFDPRTDAAAGIDAQPRCNPQAPFTTISRIDSLSTVGRVDGAVRLSADETVAYFHSDRDVFNFQIWSAKRASRDLPFETPTVVQGPPPIYWPSVTPDQLTLLSANGNDIFVATRATVNDVFPTGVLLASLDSTASQNNAFIDASGTTLYFTRYEPDAKLYSSPWPPTGTPSVIAELDTAANESAPTVSDDDLVIYFARETNAQLDIFMAQRDSATSTFGAAVMVGELTTATHESPTWLSHDLCRLYFESSRSTGTDFDIYLAERQP